jgi:hypothetical protein
MDVVSRRILSGVVLLLFALSGAYATASPRVTSPVRIEISIAERETVEQQTVRPRLARIRESAAPKPAESPSPRAGRVTVLYQRPPPSVQTRV